MTTRAIINGEMATSGSKMFLSDVEEVAQNIETRLKWFYGEAFLETSGGTPWFQKILGKNTGLEREAAIKKTISETPGVVKITSFNMVDESRVLSVTGSVITIYAADPIEFSVEL